MQDAIAEFFTKTFTNPYVATLLIAMVPVVELRGAIPYMFFARLGGGGFANVSKAFLTAYIGSSAVAPLLLLLLLPLISALKRTRVFRRLAEALERHFGKKSKKLEDKANAKYADADTEEETDPEKAEAAAERRRRRIERAKYIGIYAFTAIPLPLTGVWSASAVAAFLRLDFGKSLAAILLGNLTAGVIVSLICAFTGWLV